MAALKTFSSIALLLTLLFTKSGVAQDIEIPATANYLYDSPKTHYLSINFNAFESRAADKYDFVYDASPKPYKFFRNGDTNFGYAETPLYLPDGASIEKITYWVYDNVGDELTRLRIYRMPLGGTTQTMATVQTNLAFTSVDIQEVSSSTIAFKVIDNENYSYYLEFSASASNTEELRLHAVQIEYTVGHAD